VILSEVGSHENVIPEIIDDGKVARGVEKRVLIGPKNDAPNYIMRHFRIFSGGFTPDHSHPWEHEVYILKGSGTLKTSEGKKAFKAGDYVFVKPDEKHQFINDSKEALEFICVIPKYGQ
jgi:quercetin dioxygenase-like cupin family protein